MSNQEQTIELFDDDEIQIESRVDSQIHDINGNLITVHDAKNSLPDNTELIQKAIDGDKSAFNELYMQSYRYVFFVVRNYIPDDETTYDVIQEIFIKVYKNISNLSSPKAYYAWITSIAKNAAIDTLRSNRYENSVTYDDKEDVFQKETQKDKDVSLDIETVLKKLTPEEAELLSLVYYDGMHITQIAKMQGLPVTTVYSRLGKAKRNLKYQLNAHGIDKAIYSGNFISIITISMRNAIGTALLSFAIAQQILNSILGKKSKKELAIAKLIISHQRKLALKIASCIVAIAMFTSAFTVLLLTDWGRTLRQQVEKSASEIVETVTEYHYYNESSTDTDDTVSESGNNFWQNLFGGNSSTEEAKNESENNSTGGFWEMLFGTESNNSSEDNSYDENDDSHQEQSGSSSDTATSSDDNSQSGSSQASSSVPSYTPSSSTTSTTSSTPTTSTVPDGFVPDCDASEYNILGNEYSNCNVAMQGDWIYYCTGTDFYEEGRGLYKVKKDGTQKQHLCNWPIATNYNYINVVGPWIYYIRANNIWRMLTDGTGDELVYDTNATTLQIYDNVGYFNVKTLSTETEYISGGFYKIDLSTLQVSPCEETYFTDKYRIQLESDNDRYAIYDLKTGSLAATISTSYGSTGIKCYNSAFLIGKYVFDLNNLNAEPIDYHVNITQYKKSVYFYSPYKGGCVGGWFGDIIDGCYYSRFTGIIYMSDLSQQDWPFAWKCIESVYGPLKNRWYAVFGDYVYYIDGTNLHKVLPDGTNHTVIG